MTNLADSTVTFNSSFSAAIPYYSFGYANAEEKKAALFIKPRNLGAGNTAIATDLSGTQRDNYIKDASSAISGKVIYLLDRLVSETGYIQFLLLQAEMPFQEKYNLVRLSGDQYMVHFTGREPPIFSYGGILVNAYNAGHLQDFIAAYNVFLRSSKTSRVQTETVVRYDNLRVSGQMLGMTSGLRGEQQVACSFSFQLLVRKMELKLKGASDSYLGGLINIFEKKLASAEEATSSDLNGS